MTSPTSDRRQGLVGNTPIKAPVTVVATTPITLSGEQTIDTVAVKAVNAAGVPDRVLTTAQADATQNGIWDVSTGAWTRSKDADGNYDIVAGTQVVVTGGTHAFWVFIQTVVGALTIGTSALAWAANTSISFLATIAASGGAALVGFVQAASATFKTRTVQDKLRDTVLNALDLAGVLGNSTGTTGNGNDDTAGLQAGLDYLGTIGGGTLRLTKAPGAYRITNGLKMPSFVTIEGPNGDRYPYNSNAGATFLYADFASATQWIIEPKTTVAAAAVAYNAYITAFPSGPTYNCAVRNLQIRANTSATPVYGGIRMHGCPGCVVDNVSVVNTGTGVFLNECYGGSCQAHTITYYYGFVGWQEVNANDINVYSTILNSATKVVPAGYVPSFLSALSATLTTTYNLTTNAHYNRCWGVVLGADSTTNSVTNSVSVTVEGFSGGILQLGSTGTAFQRLYLEGASGEVDFGFVAAKSSITSGSFHNFASSSGAAFDVGSNCRVDIAATGLISYSTFGTVYLSTTTTFILRDVVFTALGGAPIQYNVSYASDFGTPIAPTLLNSWANIGGASTTYKKNHATGNIEIKGRLGGGVIGNAFFTLPAGYRPSTNRLFSVASNNGATLGSVLVNTAGSVSPVTGNGADMSLDGIIFTQEQ